MMVKRFLPGAGLLLGLLFVTAVGAHAADFTLYAGGIVPGKVEYDGDDAALDNSPVIGVRFSSQFVPLIGLDHTFAVSADFLFPRVIPAVRDAKGFIYNSNLIFNFPVSVSSAVPYLTAGAGLVHQYGDADMPVGTKFAFNYGGGLKFPRLAGPVGLRFDMRGYRIGMISTKLNMFEISGGLMVSIGR